MREVRWDGNTSILPQKIEKEMRLDINPNSNANCKKNGHFAWKKSEPKKVYPHHNSLITCLCSQASITTLSMNGL